MEVNKENIEIEMEKIQKQIKDITELRPSTPLPTVIMAPNLARGSSEMWQIYQYQLQEHETLKNLTTEQIFLRDLLEEGITESKVYKRLNLLVRKEKSILPRLSQPTTTSIPLKYEQKVDRAKLIARHIKKSLLSEDNDPMDNIDRIKNLQSKLMQLEEEYMSADI